MTTAGEIVDIVQSILGYTFEDRNLLIEALKAAGPGMNVLRSRTARTATNGLLK
jgi:hypothetical protein